MGKHHPAGIPQYLEHKTTGHARVKIDGHEIWLGSHGSPASREKYDRVIAEWLANGRRLPPDYVSPSERTVSEIIIEYLPFAKQEYSRDGRPTKEYLNLKSPLRILQQLYGSTPVGNFGPRALKTIRQAMVDRHLRADGKGKRPKPLSRGYINESVNRIRRMFRWAVEQELAPPEVIHKLNAVSGLRHGKGGREPGKITVVPDAFIEAVRPFVSRQVWGLIQLQLCTGMRPGEAICLRGRDLNMDGKLWEINPTGHKTAHFGINRLILVGPKGQAVIQPFLKPNSPW